MVHHDTESQIRLCQHFVVLGLKEGDLSMSQNYKASYTLKCTAQGLLQNDPGHSKSSSLSEFPQHGLKLYRFSLNMVFKKCKNTRLLASHCSH